MTQPTGTCPQCGAKITFRWSSSVQTVCSFCKSILVRTDVDLERVGKVADLPPDSSPIQIGTEGVYGNEGFVVAGRIIYDYDQGSWNEWHMVMSRGAGSWLSDSQDEYAVTSAAAQNSLPASVNVGERYTWNGVQYEVTTITKAHYRGVEGELPFRYWDKDDVLFADLRSSSGDFATLDYSDAEPVLYVGRAVGFDDLHLKNLRKFEGWR